jgi:hypothetical protein
MQLLQRWKSLLGGFLNNPFLMIADGHDDNLTVIVTPSGSRGGYFGRTGAGGVTRRCSGKTATMNTWRPLLAG